MSGRNGTHKNNSYGRNGHTEAAQVSGAPHRLTGDGAAPLEPSVTARPPPAPAPEQARAEGRDSASGRFTAGNHFGKGNPHARRMAALRTAFLETATPERMKELGAKLFAAALAGDWQAATLFLRYVIGRPSEAINPDTLDADEWERLSKQPRIADVVAAAMGTAPADLAADFVRAQQAQNDSWTKLICDGVLAVAAQRLAAEQGLLYTFRRSDGTQAWPPGASKAEQAGQTVSTERAAP
jgi:hypothetical protein